MLSRDPVSLGSDLEMLTRARVADLLCIYFLFHQKTHRLASHMASHARVRWLGVTLSAMSCLDTLGSTVSCIISPPAPPSPLCPQCNDMSPSPHVTWCQWLMQSEQCTHPAEPFMRRALLFSECPSTKIFIPCSHLAPATKLSHVTTLYPRVIGIGNIFVVIVNIFLEQTGTIPELAVRCVKTMPRLLTDSRWHGVASDPRDQAWHQTR